MDAIRLRPKQNLYSFSGYADSGLIHRLGAAGFTMVELMFTSMLSVLLLMAVFHVSYLLDNAKQEYGSSINLTSKTRQTLDKMIFGIVQSGQSNRRGISEAVSAVVSPTQIDYTDVNAVTHSIRLNNGNIEYRRGSAGVWTTYFDPNGTAVFDATVDSTNLSFSQTNPRAVTIKLILGKIQRGRWCYASVSTQVSFRNS